MIPQLRMQDGTGISVMVEKLRLRWVALLLFHISIVLFSGILPGLSPSANSMAAFYDNPDKALNTCILQWNLNSLTGKSNLGITEAPIFFPCRYVKFFSEHLFAHIVYAYPVSLFGASPQTVYNLTYELNRLTLGVSASLLCLELGSAFLPALIAGGLFISAWKLGQLQNTGMCWALLTMLFFIRQLKTPRWRNVFGIFVFMTLTGLSSGYLAFYTPLALLFLLIVRIVAVRKWPGKKWALQMSIAAVLISLALAPTMMSYRKVQRDYGLVREGYTVARLALPFQESQSARPDEGPYQEVIAMSPAALAEVFLFAGALFLVLRRRSGFDGWEWGFSCLAILSFWITFTKFSPYFLLANLPGFNGLRAAYRWYLFGITGLTVVISLGFTALTEKYKRPARLALIGVTVLMLISVTIPGDESEPVERLPQSHVYSFLSTLPPGPVFILPVLRRGRVMYRIANSARMLYQPSSSYPMVSGYSGFIPEITRRIERAFLNGVISQSAITKLSRTGVKYIVLDHLLADTSDIANQLRRRRGCKVLYDRDGEMIVELPTTAREAEENLIRLWSQNENPNADPLAH